MRKKYFDKKLQTNNCKHCIALTFPSLLGGPCIMVYLPPGWVLVLSQASVSTKNWGVRKHSPKNVWRSATGPRTTPADTASKTAAELEPTRAIFFSKTAQLPGGVGSAPPTPEPDGGWQGQGQCLGSGAAGKGLAGIWYTSGRAALGGKVHPPWAAGRPCVVKWGGGNGVSQGLRAAPQGPFREAIDVGVLEKKSRRECTFSHR